MPMHVLIVSDSDKVPTEATQLLNELRAEGVEATIVTSDPNLKEPERPGKVSLPVIGCENPPSIEELRDHLIGVSVEDLTANTFDIDRFGYPVVLCDDHPYGNDAGYVPVHRLIMEAVLRATNPESPYLVTIPWLSNNQFLPPIVPVVHKDGDLTNWAADNLALMLLGDITASYVDGIAHGIEEYDRACNDTEVKVALYAVHSGNEVRH